jgi:hypothetical protein
MVDNGVMISTFRILPIDNNISADHKALSVLPVPMSDKLNDRLFRNKNSTVCL